MLLDQIRADINESLKKSDKTRVETLRFLLSAVGNEAIAKYQAAGEKKLTDADVLEVVKRQVKTHRESIEAFQKGGRPELVAKEQAELAILESFLPKQLSDDELRKILEPIVASGETNFGPLMGQAMAAVKGQADGGRVAALLKQML